MKGIYTYIPETNQDPREYNVAAVLLLLFMVPISLVPALILLKLYVRTSCSVCAVPNMAVFCSSFTSCFTGMLLIYFLNDLICSQSLQLLLVSPLFLPSTIAVFLLSCLYILKFSRLPF